MRYLKLTSLLACGAALVVASGCSDMPAPLEPEPIELDLQVQLDAGSGEKCWYVGSVHPDYNRHVVSWQSLFEHKYDFRFPEPLPDPGFFPEDPPLVAHVIRLFKDGTNFESENQVGTGYMVSVVGEKKGRTYNMFHQIVVQPWMEPEAGGDWEAWDYEYNAGLCDLTENVPVCTRYKCAVDWVTGEDGKETCPEWEVGLDGHVECDTFVYRPACIGTVLGTSSIDCNTLPCTNTLHRADVTFDSGTWDGFGQFASAGMHHGRGGELRQGTGDFAAYALLYGWHHGEICVTYGGGVQPPPTTYTIHASAGDGGNISPSGEVPVNEGASQAFTITADAGFAIDDVLVDGSSVGAVSSYTFENVTAAHTIHATFEEAASAPLSIDQFDLTNTSNSQFARVRVDWAVSGQDLRTVTVAITGPNNDSRTWNVSGSTAAGEHEFSFRRGFGDYTVTLTVTDANGSSTSQIKEIAL